MVQKDEVRDRIIAAVAKDTDIYKSVVEKIYDEQIRYAEFMLSQMNIYEGNTILNFRFSRILNFKYNKYAILSRLGKHILSYEYEKYKRNETSRISKLLKSHPRYGKFLKACRRKGTTFWNDYSDEVVCRYMAARQKYVKRRRS